MATSDSADMDLGPPPDLDNLDNPDSQDYVAGTPPLNSNAYYNRQVFIANAAHDHQAALLESFQAQQAQDATVDGVQSAAAVANNGAAAAALQLANANPANDALGVPPLGPGVEGSQWMASISGGASKRLRSDAGLHYDGRSTTAQHDTLAVAISSTPPGMLTLKKLMRTQFGSSFTRIKKDTLDKLNITLRAIKAVHTLSELVKNDGVVKSAVPPTVSLPAGSDIEKKAIDVAVSQYSRLVRDQMLSARKRQLTKHFDDNKSFIGKMLDTCIPILSDTPMHPTDRVFCYDFISDTFYADSKSVELEFGLQLAAAKIKAAAKASVILQTRDAMEGDVALSVAAVMQLQLKPLEKRLASAERLNKDLAAQLKKYKGNTKQQRNPKENTQKSSGHTSKGKQKQQQPQKKNNNTTKRQFSQSKSASHSSNKKSYNKSSKKVSSSGPHKGHKQPSQNKKSKKSG
jgi:hypothetical protein